MTNREMPDLTDGGEGLEKDAGRRDDNRKSARKGRLKKCMKRLLELPVADEEERGRLLAMGVAEDEADNYMLVAAAVFRKAAAGDIKFVEELRHVICDNETEIDRRTSLAQLEKIRAQTEEIRHRFGDGDDSDEEYRREFWDVLRQSAAGWSGEEE